MRRGVTLSVVLAALFTIPAYAQQSVQEAEIRRDVPFETMLREMPGLTRDQYNMAIREVAKREIVAAELLVVPTPATVSSFPLPQLAPATPMHLATPTPALVSPPAIVADGSSPGVVSSNRFGPYVGLFRHASITNLFGPFATPLSPSSLTTLFAVSPLMPLVPVRPYAVPN
jgi:hypothetical protein